MTRLNDIDFGNVASNGGRQLASMAFCVNVFPQAPYQIVAYGSGPANRFELGGETQQVRYRAFYRDRARGNGRGTRLRRARPLVGQRPSRDGNCGGPPAQLTIVLPRRVLARTTPGSYSGTLTLTVAPE
ncbi:MAG: hypothetical protein AAF515_04915 [Pseudomonadota bacterium]